MNAENKCNELFENGRMLFRKANGNSMNNEIQND